MPYAVNIGAYDFYTTHMMTSCAGFYNTNGERNTTICTKTTLPFSFNLSCALLNNLGLSPSDGQQAINWPFAVISDFIWVSPVSMALSVLSVLNIIVMGIGLLIDGLLFTPGNNGNLYACLSRSFSIVGSHPR
jgi:hypothetical protein